MKQPPIAKPVTVPVKTKSGRVISVKLNGDELLIENLKRAWKICKKQAKEKDLKDHQIGQAFYIALSEIFEKLD